MILIAAGGTGGHIYPALALADALEGWDVAFCGGAGGMEERIFTQSRWPFYGLPAAKLARGEGMHLTVPLTVLRGVSRGIGLLRRLEPRAVVGMGGYASLPAVLAAQLLGVPTILHEQNAFPGLANRLLAKRAKLVALGSPQAAGHLRTRAKVVPVGVPVSTQRRRREEGVAHFQLSPQRLTILVFGGSQGARSINEAVVSALEQLSDLHQHIQVLHATGPAHLAAVQQATQKWPWYHPVPYISQMNLAYACADLAVCRSGASTCAELAIQEVPAILVPLPTASEDHQAHNAQALFDLGAAHLIRQGDHLAEQLVQELRALLLKPELRQQLQANLARAAAGAAARRLAQEIEAALGVVP